MYIVLFHVVLHIFLMMHYNEVNNSEKMMPLFLEFLSSLLFLRYPQSAHIGSLIFIILVTYVNRLT